MSKYSKKIKTNRESVFSSIDSILKDVKDLNSQLQKIEMTDSSEQEKMSKATIKVKKVHKKITRVVGKDIVKQNKLIYDSISKIGKSIK